MTRKPSARIRIFLGLAFAAAMGLADSAAAQGPAGGGPRGFSGMGAPGGGASGGRPAGEHRGFGALREGLFERPSADGRLGAALPPVARYVSEDGDIFTLDRSQSKPLMRFEATGEVLVLQPQPAPRGDVIYKNELGEPVLRATRLGGLTVFTEHRPDGEAAALAGPGPPIRLALITPQAVLERLAQASFRATRAAHHLIVFDADGGYGGPDSSALIADAALVTSLAVVRCADKPEAQGFLSRLRRVFLVEGRRASVQFDQGTLKVTVATQQGLSGRPSSDRILQVALAR